MRRRFQRAAMGWIMALMVLPVIACFLVESVICPPGRCTAAERGYGRATPVIRALEAYHADHGEYPNQLTALVPSYMSAASLDEFGCSPDEPRRCPDDADTIHRLACCASGHYYRSGDSYGLEFGYTGPGSNSCEFSPGRPPREAATRTHDGWDCYGAF